MLPNIIPNQELLYSLFLNLFSTAVLMYILFRMYFYLLNWWLRTQRFQNLYEGHYKKRVLLEIKVPREVNKSPKAMEIFISTLYQGLGLQQDALIFKDDWSFEKYKDQTPFSEKSYEWYFEMRKRYIDKYIKGGVRGWTSLEIVSEEGNIRFFLWTYDKHVDLQRNALYSQYPGIEVVEIPPEKDYFFKHRYVPGNKNFHLYVGRYNLKKDDYLPIKTYVDYELDTDPKEEFKVDPLQSVLETMSTAGKGEYFFFQILVMAAISKKWKDKGQQRIDELLGVKRHTKESIKIDFAKDLDEAKGDEKKIAAINKRVGTVKSQERNQMSLSPSEKKEIDIISKNIEKDGFDTVVRFYSLEYPKVKGTVMGKPNVSKMVLPVVYGLKPFDSIGYNSLGFDTITLDSDYTALDPNSSVTEGKRGYYWQQYGLRAGFYGEVDFSTDWPWDTYKSYLKKKKTGTHLGWAKGTWSDFEGYWSGVSDIATDEDEKRNILNTEELATLFHIPAKIQGTSNNTVQSRKVDPPSNLPV